ncbi:release factor glutamine methyltransferase [Pseudoscourfieldia marina]
MMALSRIALTSYRADECYEPSDDTFLLADAINDDLADALKSEYCNMLAVEVGCGSGYVCTSLALNSPHIQVVATDVNHLAAKHTAQTARNHKCSNNVDIVLCNGLDAFRTRRLFDVLMCNPPYVPTEDEEIYTTTPETTTNHNSVINAAFAGGEKGRLLVDSVLMPHLADYLWKEGRAYVVALHENDVGEIQQDAKARGLESQVVMERRADMERLCVLRFTTTTTTTTTL